jgi:hypothetical protein
MFDDNNDIDVNDFDKYELEPIISSSDSELFLDESVLISFNDSLKESGLSLHDEDFSFASMIVQSKNDEHSNTDDLIDLHEISFGSIYGNCSVGCSGSCQGNCNQMCMDSCHEHCTGSCNDMCMDTCHDSCTGTSSK